MIAKLLLMLGRVFAQPDKALHALVGLALGVVALTIAVDAGMHPAWAFCAVLWAGAAVAWGKERADRTDPAHHTWDGWDAFATLLGVQIGASLALGWLTWGAAVV